MSIGICFNDDRDIDELEKLLKQKDDEIHRLQRAISNALSYNQKIATVYQNTAQAAKDPGDKLEFYGKSSGMLEANLNIRRYMTEKSVSF